MISWVESHAHNLHAAVLKSIVFYLLYKLSSVCHLVTCWEQVQLTPTNLTSERSRERLDHSLASIPGR